MRPPFNAPIKNEMRRGIALLPNLLTTANLFCGFFSVTKSLAGDYVFAVWLVVLAGFFDFMDGRVARMTNTQSRFGTEYDSLADLTTFCLAPAVLAFSWGLNQFDKLGLSAAFLYFACGALRLARFNVQSGSVERTDFQGLPTPAGAGTLVSFILFYDFVFGKFPAATTPFNPTYLATLLLCLFLGALMVSQVRYKSAKSVNRRSSFVSLIFIVATLFFILAKPEIMLFAFGVCYISYGIIKWFWTTTKQSSHPFHVLKSFFVEIETHTENATAPNPNRLHRRFGRRPGSHRAHNVIKLSTTESKPEQD